MKFNIRANKLELTNSIKDYVESKIGKLNKYFESPEDISANVVIRTDGIDDIIEVTIPIKKAVLRAEAANKDLYAAIDLVLEKLERQIRKNKTRMHNRNTKEIESMFVEFDLTAEEALENKIVKRKVIDTKPMDEEEAILQMNLLGHDFFVFKNIETDDISVIYRRKDSNYGIIDVK